VASLSLFGDSRRVIIETIADEFGEPRLTAELIPKKAWGTNLWSVLRESDWKRLRTPACEAANFRCVICGGVGTKGRIECHERWQVLEDACTQVLIGLVALCPECHQVKHIGRAIIHGRGEDAKYHLRRINEWTADQAARYLDLVFSLAQLRDLEENWYVDLSWLRQFNIFPKAHAGEA